MLEGAQERLRHPGAVQPGAGLVTRLALEGGDAADAELGHEEWPALLFRDEAEDRPYLRPQSAVDLRGVPEVPVDVDGPGIEEVAHVVCEVLEPLGLRLPSGRRPKEVAAHEVDSAADVPCAQLGVEEPVHLLVLGKRDACRVRLVEQRHPEGLADPERVDPLGEHVGEARHVGERERDAAPLPRDVDAGARPLRKRHGSFERLHAVGERPLGRVEEDPHERRPEGHYLALEHRQGGGRPADVRVDVLVELDAEAVEPADALGRGEQGLGAGDAPAPPTRGHPAGRAGRAPRPRTSQPTCSPDDLGPRPSFPGPRMGSSAAPGQPCHVSTSRHRWHAALRFRGTTEVATPRR